MTIRLGRTRFSKNSAQNAETIAERLLAVSYRKQLSRGSYHESDSRSNNVGWEFNDQRIVIFKLNCPTPFPSTAECGHLGLLGADVATLQFR